MISYIFMKILESRPQRYDRGLKIFTAGQATKIKKMIVKNYVREGMDVLDLGCGTGALSIMAAKAGARVTGVDISGHMLDVARKRARARDLQDVIQFKNAAAADLDREFDDGSMDLVICTYVFSELSPVERDWTVGEIHRILKPGGRLVVVAEVPPKSFMKRCIYHLARIPLALLTYLIAQTGTKPVSNLPQILTERGFEITEESYTLLGSLVTIVAKRSHAPRPSVYKSVMKVNEDKSLLKTILDYVGRWFPNPVEPGLRIIGNPTKDSPVIVTGNFHLTVRRVERALKAENCYLIVADSKGINVWCGSAGGDMSAESVISALKTSRVNEYVDHNQVILPQLCATGVDIDRLKNQGGWEIKWGPVYAEHLPQYISQGCRKTQEQSRVRFSLPFRMEMLLCMNWILWVGFVLIFLIAYGKWVAPFTVAFWTAGLVLYAGYYVLPFKSGWAKSLLVGAGTIIMVFAGFMGLSLPALWEGAGALLLTYAGIFSIGFDLKGIVGDQTSEAEGFLYKLGLKRLGHLYKAGGVHRGTIAKDTSACVNCGICMQVCPMGVHGRGPGKKEIEIVDDSGCLKCKACVRQCPKDALHLA